MQRKSSDAGQSQQPSDSKTAVQDPKLQNRSPRLQGFLSNRNVPPIDTAPSALTPREGKNESAPKRGNTPSS